MSRPRHLDTIDEARMLKKVVRHSVATACWHNDQAQRAKDDGWGGERKGSASKADRTKHRARKFSWRVCEHEQQSSA